MMSNLLLLSLIFLINTDPMEPHGPRPDSLYLHSVSMNREIPCLVFKPGSGASDLKRYPVLYLLHGYDGSWLSWDWLQEDLQDWSDRYGMYIVCPDGANSWYLDSPIDPEIRYESFLALELPGLIDRIYNTIPTRSGRALAGISMGGHGAAYLALRHPEIFTGFASTSGGLDLRPFSNDWNLKNLLGPQIRNEYDWAPYSAVAQIEKWDEINLKIYLDCGKDDFFLKVNRSFHQTLKKKNIAHLYLEQEGGHDADYWSRSMHYLMAFVYGMFQDGDPSASAHPWTDAP